MAVQPDTVGGRLRAAREAAGVSIRQLADALDLTRPAVSHYEAGRRSITTDTAKRAARLLGCRTGWLLGLQTHGGPGTLPPSSFPKPRTGRPRDARRSGDGRYCPPRIPDPEVPDLEDPALGLVDVHGRVIRAEHVSG